MNKRNSLIELSFLFITTASILTFSLPLINFFAKITWQLISLIITLYFIGLTLAYIIDRKLPDKD